MLNFVKVANIKEKKSLSSFGLIHLQALMLLALNVRQKVEQLCLYVCCFTPPHTHTLPPQSGYLQSAVNITGWQHLTIRTRVSCSCCRQVDKVGKQINPPFNPQSLRVNSEASPCP